VSPATQLRKIEAAVEDFFPLAAACWTQSDIEEGEIAKWLYSWWKGPFRG
jgi:hypothetical protein